jgi:hypothetical protein
MSLQVRPTSSGHTSGARRARRRPFPHASPGWWRLPLHAARTSGAGLGKAVASVQPGLPRGAHVMVPPDRRHTTSYCSIPTWQGSTGWRTPTIANGTVPKAFEEQQERRNASNQALSPPVLGSRYQPHCLLREYLASLRTPVTSTIGVLWSFDPKICIHQRITGIGRW